MNLTDTQKKLVGQWVAEGKGVSEIQKLIMSEFGVEMLYMDVRFLIDDIGAQIPEVEEKPQESDIKPDAEQPAEENKTAKPQEFSADDAAQGIGGGVSVSVNPVQRPGTMMGGEVVFSDGGKAEWVLDNSGRLGLIPAVEGYNPPQSDMAEFQQKLREALGMGA